MTQAVSKRACCANASFCCPSSDSALRFACSAKSYAPAGQLADGLSLEPGLFIASGEALGGEVDPGSFEPVSVMVVSFDSLRYLSIDISLVRSNDQALVARHLCGCSNEI